MTLPFNIEARPGGAYYIAYHDGGGHMADLPCRCLIAENRALAERADAAEAEVEALKHDIERHIAIASSEADYAEKLHKALRSAPCPADGRPTAGECYDRLECGCRIGTALATPTEKRAPS